MKKNKKHLQFIQIVWQYYQKNKRDLPWRKTNNPYHIFVSEIMLQQTQVSRVLTKYPMFISHFSSFSKLAKASIKEVLQSWQGMGYNRRALYLKKAAEIIIDTHKGLLPHDPVALDLLPGIGIATASSIVTFAYNKPTVFIETNIRRVFIHHYFEDRVLKVEDREIFPLIEQTLDRENPRKWYWALMDYGSYLGKKIKNPNKRSKQYNVQSQFEGSDRQIRGKMLKLLIENRRTEKEIVEMLKIDEKRAQLILESLEKEGFIVREKNVICLKQ